MAKKPLISLSDKSVRAAFRELRQDSEIIVNKIIEQLSYVGEKCVAIAREKGSYNDITGNLRSSIGYIILDNGVQVRYGLPRKYKEGDTGIAEAKALLDKLTAKFPRGLVLIVCAGMNYASYVEDVRGRTVLSPARLKAEELAPKLLKNLVRDIQFEK